MLIPGAPPESAWIDLSDAWWVCTGLIAFGTILWICLYRNHPEGESQAKEPVLQYLGAVLRNKDVWGVSIFAFLVFGMTNVNGSYMVAAITSLAGSGDPTIAANPDMIAMVQAQASDLSTLNTIICCIASMVLPVVFVARFSRMRTPAAICLLGTAICFGILFFLPWGPATYILYIILGIVMASVMPITKMLPALLPSVKWEQLGAVGGVQANP